MSLSIIAAVVVAGAIAGGLGSLLGIGGGVFLVPFLNAGLGLDFGVARAVSLMTVIATSSAVSSGTAGRRLINLRLGMLLEVASTAGGLAAGITVERLSDGTLSIIFACVTAVIAILMITRLEKRNVLDAAVDPGPFGGRYYEDESGGEVVYREAESLPAQTLHRRDHGSGLAHHGALRDLEHDPLRPHAEGARVLHDRGLQVGIQQVQRRQIDRNVRLDAEGAPFLHLAQRCSNDPVREQRNRSCALGQRHELAGGNGSMLGMIPAQQRLQTANRVRAHLDLRLIHEAELIRADRTAQIAEDGELASVLLVVTRIVHGDHRALFLRVEQRGVDSP